MKKLEVILSHWAGQEILKKVIDKIKEIGGVDSVEAVDSQPVVRADEKTEIEEEFLFLVEFSQWDVVDAFLITRKLGSSCVGIPTLYQLGLDAIEWHKVAVAMSAAQGGLSEPTGLGIQNKTYFEYSNGYRITVYKIPIKCKRGLVCITNSRKMTRRSYATGYNITDTE